MRLRYVSGRRDLHEASILWLLTRMVDRFCALLQAIANEVPASPLVDPEVMTGSSAVTSIHVYIRAWTWARWYKRIGAVIPTNPYEEVLIVLEMAMAATC